MNRDSKASARSSVEPDTKAPKPRKRKPNLYDAVAGRVSISKSRIAPSLENAEDRPNTFDPLRPDEVLFRRPEAPTRYAEDDFYFANEHLPPEQKLPDSDLLKTLHTYTSDFYGCATADNGRTIWSTMDETALLALGILLEETAVEALGATGDMVFVEGDEDGEADEDAVGSESDLSVSQKRSSMARGWTPRNSRARARSIGVGRSDDEAMKYRRTPKRRRISVSGRSMASDKH